MTAHGSGWAEYGLFWHNDHTRQPVLRPLIAFDH